MYSGILPARRSIGAGGQKTLKRNMTDVLKETNFDFLGPKKTGKVRDIYDQGEQLILITTDRHSSFDRIIAHIPWKGQVLNEISAFWFEKTKDIVPNHVIAIRHDVFRF